MVIFGSMIFSFSFVPSLVVSSKPADMNAAKQANPVLKMCRLGIATLRFSYNLAQMMLCGYMSLVRSAACNG